MVCEELRRYALQHDLATRVVPSREPVNREAVSREPVSRETISREPVSREAISREAISRESAEARGLQGAYGRAVQGQGRHGEWELKPSSLSHFVAHEDAYGSDASSVNEENYILEEPANDAHEHLAESGGPETVHTVQKTSVATPHSTRGSTPHSTRGSTPHSTLSSSPSIPALQLSPTMYSANVIPYMNAIYPYTVVGSQPASQAAQAAQAAQTAQAYQNLQTMRAMQSAQSTQTAQNAQSTQSTQTAQSSQRHIALPESFRFLQDSIEDPRVRSLYSRMEPCLAENVADTIKMNFFFGYAVFWLLSSPALRQLLLSCADAVAASHAAHSTPTPSPSKPASPESATLPSMSPSIQPVYMVLQVAPQLGAGKSEVEVLSALAPEVAAIVESASLSKASKVLVAISQEFLANNLLNKYQQFGISFPTLAGGSFTALHGGRAGLPAGEPAPRHEQPQHTVHLHRRLHALRLRRPHLHRLPLLLRRVAPPHSPLDTPLRLHGGTRSAEQEHYLDPVPRRLLSRLHHTEARRAAGAALRHRRDHPADAVRAARLLAVRAPVAPALRGGVPHVPQGEGGAAGHRGAVPAGAVDSLLLVHHLPHEREGPDLLRHPRNCGGVRAA